MLQVDDRMIEKILDVIRKQLKKTNYATITMENIVIRDGTTPDGYIKYKDNSTKIILTTYPNVDS